jgi:hypothetical protein
MFVARAQSAPVPEVKAKEVHKVKRKNDPKRVAAARELRDRWMERVNADPSLLLPHDKYEVSRELPAPAALAAHDVHAVPVVALPAMVA